MGFEKLQEMNANGNLGSIISEQGSDLVPTVDADSYDFNEATGALDYEPEYEYEFEYFTSTFMSASGRKQKRLDRKAKRRDKKADRKEKRADKKEAKGKTKRAAKLDKKANLKREEAKAFRDAETKAEAKAKVSALRQEMGTKGQKLLAKAGRGIKKAGLAPQRAAMIALIKLNAFGLASKMKKSKEQDRAKYQNLMDRWYNWGGDRNKLMDYINTGAKKKPIAIKWRKNKGAEGDIDSFTFDQELWDKNADNEWKNFEPASTTALIATATPLIIGIFQALGINKGDEDVDDETIDAMKQEAASQAPEIQSLQEEQAKINEMVPESERDAGGLFTTKNLLIGGGILFGIGLTAYFLLRKRK